MEESQRHDLTPVANQLLRRLQAYNTRILDKTSIELIELFVSTFGPERIKELRDLGKLSLDDANRFMTVKFRIEAIGVNTGKNPSREIERMQKVLETIKTHPFILYTTEERGKRVYNDLPLIKYRKVDPDGMCTVIFNDALRYLFYPDKFYGLISFDLLKEIRQHNFYAAIIYEEACSYAGMKGHNGEDPFFSWSLKETREKFGFDRMVNFDKDMITYDTEVIKSMRPDIIRKNIFVPALMVLEKFFIDGKLEFWLDLVVGTDLKSMRPGRPPKDFFRIFIRRNKRKAIENHQQKGEQLDLFEYEEMNTLYYIREQLNTILGSKRMINKIMDQLKNNEQIGSQEEVLTTIKNKRSEYDSRPKNDKARLILSILGKEHHLGDPSKYGKPCKDDERFWPDNLEERIKVMMESSEIKDRAAQEHGLSSQNVETLLQVDFYQTCLKNNKLKKDWSDAVDYFFNWLKKLGIRGPIENTTYVNNKQRKSNYGRATTSNYGQTAAIFLNESTD